MQSLFLYLMVLSQVYNYFKYVYYICYGLAVTGYVLARKNHQLFLLSNVVIPLCRYTFIVIELLTSIFSVRSWNCVKTMLFMITIIIIPKSTISLICVQFDLVESFQYMTISLCLATWLVCCHGDGCVGINLWALFWGAWA